MSSHVYKDDLAIGGLALIEPGTGNVKGLAQSRPMGKRKGETFLNYTVPTRYGDASGFQPGSTFKAFVLASAINQDIPLTQRYPAPNPGYFPLNEFETCDGPYQSTEIWRPKNSTSSSSAPNLYEGTQKSVNTFFVNLEKQTGICEPWKLARQMGITELTEDNIIPSFTLGVADVSPLEMAEAYATFAGEGLHCDARPVTEIADAQGNVLKKYEKSCTQVLASPVANAVNDVLRGVVAPGGFAALQYPGQPAAGKTGTTNGNNSVWFVGYTPNLAGAAMVAGVNRAGQPESLDNKSVGGRTLYASSGSTTAGPIWGDAFKVIAQWLDDVDFTRPSTTDIRGLLITVPAVSGKSYDEAKAVLEGLGFNVVNGGEVDSAVAAGLVAWSAPGTGARLAAGDTVTLYISDGTPKKKKGKKGGGAGTSDAGTGGTVDAPAPPDPGGEGPGNGNGNGVGNGNGNGNGGG
ncbi:penicillin-binding transpeptidase domain-containing protein [Nocardioides sp. R1-1]|uniref:transglycosylase domain-containing protein n=1 Tax=Nocardioides sp. R1-1 TaxID=3383502 RepID=UPI0038D19DBE